MRSIALASMTLLSIIFADAAHYSPFSDPLVALSDEESFVKRQGQGNCQAGYNSCAGSGGSGSNSACCPNGSNCTQDAAGNAACCPTSALCTGIRSGGIGTPTASVSNGTSPTSGVIIGTTTVGNPTITTTQAPAAALPTTGVAGGGSTVPNSFYPFVYIPTSYATPSLCLSAYAFCQSQSTACAQSLGGTNGVTVSGNGGGITVGGSGPTTLNAASASSICSVLSSQACYNINSASCGITTSGGVGTVSTNSGGTTTVIPSPNWGPRPTACPQAVYAAGAGAVVGLAAYL